MSFEYFKYLNLPLIPNELIEFNLDKIEAKANRFRSAYYQYYKQYRIDVDSDLGIFLKSIVKMPFVANYQVIRDGIDIHKDAGRTGCFNYLLDTGGDDTKLVVYDEDKTKVLHEEHILPFKWHWIFVNRFHTVKSIVRPRIAVSLSFGMKNI
jgi:hypothetical protein